MSGGPPSHHSHGLPANAWNHLQIPTFFPGRQPQHAHMSSEHPLLHQPTWHTPTTEPVKTLPHSHLFNLEQMLNTRHSPGVDLSLAATRNGQNTNTNSQNGELPQAPISLSVRDAKQINSLPMGALDAGDIKKTPISPSSNAANKKSDPSLQQQFGALARTEPQRLNSPASQEKPSQSVIVSTVANSSSHDENSNSSNTVQEDEDSLDSSKSRRKRKPYKTVRLTPTNREDMDLGPSTQPPIIPPKEPEPEVCPKPPAELLKAPETVPEPQIPAPTAEISKCSSPEVIEPPPVVPMEITETPPEVPLSIAEPSSTPAPEPEPSNINANTADSSQTPPQTAPLLADASENAPTPQKDTQTTFVAVEDELEKMFAGIAETKTPSVPLEVPSTSNQPFDGVTSTSSEIVSPNGNKASHKRGRPKGSKNNSRRSSTCNSVENTPKKKHKGSKKKASRDESPGKTLAAVNKALMSKMMNKKAGTGGKKSNLDTVKDVYAYDSGSNTSSTKSKGPFVQIRGPRDSPISVNIVNGPSNDDEHSEKKAAKSSKKFHDDSEYRHKVRSKGLHCSTLSNKYDAQTKDVTWICVFCKRGPHAAEPAADPNLLHLQVQYSPGDLFGPYIITTDCSEFQRRINDPFDLLFKSKKAALKAAQAASAASAVATSPKKVKRKHTESESAAEATDVYEGMVEASANTYEVWTHEECVIWSPGVYLVGPKIVGLEGAVWGSCSVPCARCGMKGAAVCCLKRGCNATMHVGCARLSEWRLDEDSYKTYCDVHAAAALAPK